MKMRVSIFCRDCGSRLIWAEQDIMDDEEYYPVFDVKTGKRNRMLISRCPKKRFYHMLKHEELSVLI